MAKYDNMHENIGEIFVAELFSVIEDEHITENELFKRKLVNKFNEIYGFALVEAITEIKETLDAIESLKTNKL